MPAEAATATTDNRALRSIGVQFFVNGAVVASYIPLLPSIRDRIDVGIETLGLVLSIATLGGLIGSVAVGRLLTHSTRRLMTVGSIVLVTLLPLVATVSSWWQLLLVLGAIAAVDVVVDVAMNMQGSVLSARRSVPVMNRLHAMWSFGTVVGSTAATALAYLGVSFGWHLVLVASFLLGSLLYVAPGLLPVDEPYAESSGAGAVTGGVVLFLLLGGAAIVPEMITSDWAAFRLADDLGAGAAAAGLGYFAFTSGMFVSRLSGDYAVAKFGAERVLRAAGLTAVFGIAVATLVDLRPIVYAGFFIAGLGVAIMFPQLYDQAAKAQGSKNTLGALTAGSRLALLVAPAVVGWTAANTSLNVGASIALVTIPCAIFVARR